MVWVAVVYLLPCGITQWEGHFKPPVAGIRAGRGGSVRAVDPWHPAHIHHPRRLPGPAGRDDEN